MHKKLKFWAGVRHGDRNLHSIQRFVNLLIIMQFIKQVVSYTTCVYSSTAVAGRFSWNGTYLYLEDRYLIEELNGYLLVLAVLFI